MSGDSTVRSSGVAGCDADRLTPVAEQFLTLSKTATILGQHIRTVIGIANGNGSSAAAYDHVRAGVADGLDQFAAAARKGEATLAQTILEQRRRTGSNGQVQGQAPAKTKPASIWTNWHAPFLPEGAPRPDEFGKTAKEVRATWESLPPEARELYIQEYPREIGRLDGVPVSDRDAANRDYLSDYLNDPTHANDRDPQYGAARKLQDMLRESNRSLYLIGFDPKAHDGRAIVSMGNPDYASDVVFYTPGVQNALKEVPSLLNERGARVYDQARGLNDKPLSYVLYLYDTPSTQAEAVQQDLARRGAAEFVPFVRAWRETNPTAHASIIAHSYGSVTVGTAAASGQLSGLVDELIFAGSPGLTVDHVSGLNFDPRHVWVMAHPQDIIANSEQAAVVAQEEAARYAREKGESVGGSAGGWIAENLARGHAASVGLSLGAAADYIHGPKPHAEAFGANVILVPPGDYKSALEAAKLSHSSYWDTGSEGLKATAGIVRGMYDVGISLDHGSLPYQRWQGRH